MDSRYRFEQNNDGTVTAYFEGTYVGRMDKVKVPTGAQQKYFSWASEQTFDTPEAAAADMITYQTSTGLWKEKIDAER